MKKGIQIKIEKLRAVDNPGAPTPAKEKYMFGESNPGVSLPTEYWAIGVLEADVEIGKSLKMLRSNRNGDEIPGNFSTSLIKEINGDTVKTENSVYKITVLN